MTAPFFPKATSPVCAGDRPSPKAHSDTQGPGPWPRPFSAQEKDTGSQLLSSEWQLTGSLVQLPPTLTIEPPTCTPRVCTRAPQLVPAGYLHWATS